MKQLLPFEHDTHAPPFESPAQQAQGIDLNDLYARAFDFLREDYRDGWRERFTTRNPNGLNFLHGFATASVGKEIEGVYYRLTQGFSTKRGTVAMGMVVVEQIPDEGVVERPATAWDRATRWADDRIEAKPLWRLQPEREVWGEVSPAAIEDLSKTRLVTRRGPAGYPGSRSSGSKRRVAYLSPRNGARLQGEALESAGVLIAALLDRLDAK